MSEAQGPKKRTPAEIATLILNFPLDKNPRTPYTGEKIEGCSPQETFEYHLGEAIDSAEDGIASAKGDVVIKAITKRRDERQALLDGLQALKGNVKLEQSQIDAFNTALTIIHELANRERAIAQTQKTYINPNPGTAGDLAAELTKEASPKRIDRDVADDKQRGAAAVTALSASRAADNIAQLEPLFMELAKVTGLDIQEGPAKAHQGERG